MQQQQQPTWRVVVDRCVLCFYHYEMSNFWKKVVYLAIILLIYTFARL